MRLTKALAAAGASVSVVAPARGVAETVAGPNGVDVVRVSYSDRLSLPRAARPWRAAGRQAVEALQPELVHGHGTLLGGLVAGDLRGVPRVVTAHGDPRADMRNARSRLGAGARVRLQQRLISRVLENVDAVIDVHPRWEVNLPAQPHRFVHIPNIVDDSFFALARNPEPGRVLYCGGSRRIKGWDVLVAAWPEVRRAIRDAVLEVVGWRRDRWSRDAPDPIEGMELSEASVDALASAMTRAAALVIPSRYEVAPVLLGEAWAAGLPVVTTDAGGLSTLAPGAATVVPTESPALLANALVDVLLERVDVGGAVAEGRRRARLQAAELVAEAHLALYQRLAVRG